MARLREIYQKTLRGRLMQRFAYDNQLQAPRLEKIVLNMGIGEAVANPKAIPGAVAELAMIAGQRPMVTTARRSEATFKLRSGMPIGCKVTLRRSRMYEFLDRLVNVALPRVRDFRGLAIKGFDGNGNYNMGLGEQIVFPEIDYDKIEKVRGLDIAFVTSAATDEEALALLRGFDMPFQGEMNG